MIKHKYTVYIHADYTEGIFGNSFKKLLPDIGVVSKKTEIVSIQSNRELVKEQQEHILDLYRDGLSKIELPKGKIVPTIKYMGTIEVTKTEPDEINILKL